MKKRIWAFILVLVMLPGLTGCAAHRPDLTDKGDVSLGLKASMKLAQQLAEQAAAEAEAKKPFHPVEHGDICYEDLSYHVYDSTEFDAACESLAAATDADEAIRLYEWLYDEYVTVDSLYTVCYIEYCKDVSDEALQEDQVACEKVANDCWDKYCAATRDCLKGACGGQFAAYLGEDAAEAFRDYEDMTDRERELIEEETRLVALYYEQLEETESLTYNYNGQDWTMEMLEGLLGRRLDYNTYYKIYDGINAAVNAVLGDTYLKLVAVRTELAGIYGYDSYADYAYENVYGRDYTTDDAQVLCDAVKEIGRAFYEDVYANELIYSDFSYASDSEALLAMLGQYANALDGRIGEAWSYLTGHRMHYISDSPDMMDAGYTTTVNEYKAPFIYVALSGQIYDMGTLTHEFGHFCDAYWNQPGNIILESGSYDVFEIHSTGMEVIFQRYYEDMYGDRATEAEFYSLLNLLYSVITGCVFDEFQRRVYDNPDMTLAEINTMYYKLCLEYGEYEPTGHDYYWMYIPHNFESPMYYISYGVSALASLQLWGIQQEDPERAMETYMDILGRGAYDYGYMELIEAVGLKSFAVEGAAREICDPVISYCAKLK